MRNCAGEFERALWCRCLRGRPRNSHRVALAASRRHDRIARDGLSVIGDRALVIDRCVRAATSSGPGNVERDRSSRDLAVLDVHRSRGRRSRGRCSAIVSISTAAATATHRGRGQRADQYAGILTLDNQSIGSGAKAAATAATAATAAATTAPAATGPGPCSNHIGGCRRVAQTDCAQRNCRACKHFQQRFRCEFHTFLRITFSCQLPSPGKNTLGV